jgi:hypothetical protein
MTVKELMGYLSVMNPESELHFSFGDSDLYRMACARMIAEQPVDVDYKEAVTPMLEWLEIKSIEFSLTVKDACITFEQSYICNDCINKEIAMIRHEIDKKA